MPISIDVSLCLSSGQVASGTSSACLQDGAPVAVAGSSDPRHNDAAGASNSFLLGLESIRAEIKEAVRCSQSAKDAADRHEVALLETRRDVADLSVFMKNRPHHREPTTQDYLAALRLAPDAFTAIKWPITSMKEFNVAVLAALDARGVAVDELVALGMLTAPCLTPRVVPSSGDHGQAREPLSPARRPVASPSLAPLPGAGEMLDPSSPDYTPGAPDSPLQGSPAYTPMTAAWLPSPRRSTTPPSANSTHLASSPYASSDAGLSSPHLSPSLPSSDGELQRSTTPNYPMEETPACTPLKTAWGSLSRPSHSPPAIQRLVRPNSGVVPQTARAVTVDPSDVYREETPEIFSDDGEPECSAADNKGDPVEAEWRKTKRAKIDRQDKKGSWDEHVCIDISDEED